MVFSKTYSWAEKSSESEGWSGINKVASDSDNHQPSVPLLIQRKFSGLPTGWKTGKFREFAATAGKITESQGIDRKSQEILQGAFNSSEDNLMGHIKVNIHQNVEERQGKFRESRGILWWRTYGNPYFYHKFFRKFVICLRRSGIVWSLIRGFSSGRQ